MAYSRFGENSDVYIYHAVGGYISCCLCNMNDDGSSRRLLTRSQAIEHVTEHIKRGDGVSTDALRLLQRELEERGDELGPYDEEGENL